MIDIIGFLSSAIRITLLVTLLAGIILLLMAIVRIGISTIKDEL